MGKSRPIIWSIAGNDSGGGAGLSADARAADACGVHLCPVVAAVTAQNSVGVARIEAIAPDVLDAQLAALAADMSPAAIKTGLLGSAQNIAVVARWVDALRARGPLALVVDPVLRASTGAAFADEAVLRAYVTELLPRATLITPNGGEAVRLVGALQGRDVVDERVGEGGLPLTPALSPEGRGRSGVDMHEAAAMDAVRPPPQPSPRGGGSQSLATPVAPVLPPLPPGEGAGVRGRPASAATSANTAPDAPTLAHALRAAGAQSVAITGGDSALGSGWSLDWLDTPHASGWLALPRIDTPHTHGTGCTFATSAAAALARGFVPADALVLAKQATTHAIAHGYAAGQGAGPVAARAGFATEPGLTPFMSWGANFDMAPPPFWGGLGWASTTADASKVVSPHPSLPPKGKGAGSLATLYAIVDSPARVRQLLQAGVRLVQLRIKTPAAPDAAWHAALRQSIAQALADCRAAGATLVVNDHWRLAAELAAGHTAGLAVHLGQEDLLALGDAGRAALAASGLPLGISSHSLWELARARSMQPWYVACGPVWPTLTKDMPWVPQGLDNLRWWVHMAGVPVVAIGGILDHAQATQAAQTGAAAVCIVRGLGDDPAQTVPAWQAAIDLGHAAPRPPVPMWPHRSLA